MQLARLQAQPRLAAGTAARRQRSLALVVRANDGSSTGVFQAGQRVKIVKPVKIYHFAKGPQEGVQLEGMEGTVLQDVTHYKGKVLSANLPYIVELQVPVADGSATAKVKAHLGEDELAAV